MINLNKRIFYAVLLVIVILLGLLSRIYQEMIPDFIGVYIGDILWGLMIYIGFRVVFINKKVISIVVMAILFTTCIEVSQLYHVRWLDNIRNTSIGGLVLGYVFVWSDFICYYTGIAIGVLINIIKR